MSALSGMLRDSCTHPALSRWELNPVTFVYVRRCVRCGRVMERLTQAELDVLPSLDVPAALEVHIGRKPPRNFGV